jgi:glycosyltransferase involved in cell wall biosynthesis
VADAQNQAAADAGPDAPLVSVVTATYNRSNVLRYAIDSVRAQTLDDWELIVVGDACTDDTETVVASFDDPRIRFVNLAENVGEQSGPNNEGVRLSRGRYVAFLNHDDIWLPPHLANLVEGLERSGADLVFSLMSIVQADGTRILGSACASERFEPLVSVNASGWLLRRSLADEVGPWRHFRECYVAPSQDWLHRAHRLGRSLVLVPRLSVVAVPSGFRARSYADRHDSEHQEIAARLRDEPDFLERELTAIALTHAHMDPQMGANPAVRPYALRALKNMFRQLALRLGIAPATARQALGLRRGALIDQFRQTRGLAAKPRRPRKE